MRPKLILLLLLLGGGLAFGLVLPRWRTITIVFEPGGRTYRLNADSARPLPGTMQVDDDGRLRLRVINRDSVGHAAGVLGLPAQDSAIVSAELCTGTHEHGQSTLVLH